MSMTRMRPYRTASDPCCCLRCANFDTVSTPKSYEPETIFLLPMQMRVVGEARVDVAYEKALPQIALIDLLSSKACTS